MGMKLYHGTNNPKRPLRKEACFTKDKNVAKDYAFYWWREYGSGHPYTLIVEGDFEYVGGSEEYKLRSQNYKIIKIKKHRTTGFNI